MKKTDLKKFNIPDNPGVYFFLKGKDILYIGKATSLKSRVRSYFPGTTLGEGRLLDSRGPHIMDMLVKASSVKWQETDSVLEALILEANLIKKHKPYYNTKEKDDKSFNYVCITDSELPKVVVVRGRELQKSKSFSSRALSSTKSLSGTRNQEKTSVSYAKIFGPYTNSLQLREAMKIIRKIFPYLDNKSKNYHEFYKQLGLVPVSDGKGTKDGNFRKLYLRNIRNISLFLSGKKKKILKDLEKEMKGLAKEEKFEEAGEIKKKIFALKHINDIALLKDPKSTSFNFKSNFRIEGYDIAHTSGQSMVGVMTVIEGGHLNKNAYRKFSIKTLKGSNDTGALREVLKRRFAHPEWQYPKLLVVDGSTAQINVAKRYLDSIGVLVPVVGVVKDKRHKPKEIKAINKTKKLQELISRLEKEILLVNSEAHRFAIKYHKQVRAKNFLK